MADSINTLSEDQLDGIVGGRAPLPAALERFAQPGAFGRGAYVRVVENTGHKIGSRPVPADRFDEYVARHAGKGATTMTLETASGKRETMQIADIMKMYGK